MELEREWSLNTHSPKVGAQLVPINEQTVQPDDGSINRNRRVARVIMESDYNPHNGHFYIVQLKELPESDEDYTGYRPWILEIYDANMELLLKREFPKGSYERSIFPTNRGILIKKAMPMNTFNQQKAVYHEFIYH